MKPFAKISTALSALFIVLAAAPVHAAGFSSPSGNIICYQLESPASTPIPERDLVCLIFNANWAPPGTAMMGDQECDLDQTREITLPFNGPATERWVCHGDIFWPFDGKISYGSEWSFFDYTCQMETTGVACQNGNGNGFSMRRADRTLY